jgi:hypoxanthine phosphoribosyltransferase
MNSIVDHVMNFVLMRASHFWRNPSRQPAVFDMLALMAGGQRHRSHIPVSRNKLGLMETLLSESVIAERVAALGQIFTEMYRGLPLTVLGVLNGSVVLVADLIRAIDIPHQIGFVKASSYRGQTTVAGSLTISTELLPVIAGRDVLLVDDIFDTGRTMVRLLNELSRHNPASIRTMVLLWKQGRSEVPITPDFHGFQIPDVFVVGYGLDYNDDYRHLPRIEVLRQDDLK